MILQQELAKKIRERDLTVGVLGLGYVGLPLANAFVHAGCRVRGFDVDKAKVDALRDGDQYLDHLAVDLFTGLANNASFSATTDMTALRECDAILVAVPTPLGVHQEPDLTYVEAAASHIGAAFRPGQIVMLESTTYPGTTRDVFLPKIVASSRAECVLGDNLFVGFSPEREDPGRDIQHAAVPKLVGGLDDASVELGTALYEIAFNSVIRVDSAEVAEAAKLLENIFRAVNIALVNEMKTVLEAIDIDVWKVVEAASTKPFGFMKFTPGPGLGGHCIPIDPFYLSWRAKEAGMVTQFIELAGTVNRQMPTYVVDRVAEALNRSGLAVSQSRVLIVGLAYKPGIGDTRESPSIELIRLLRQRGANVDYHDDYVPETILDGDSDSLGSVPLTAESLKLYDALVVATAHPGVDWELVADHAQMIVDTRNALAAHAASLGHRLVRA